LATKGIQFILLSNNMSVSICVCLFVRHLLRAEILRHDDFPWSAVGFKLKKKFGFDQPFAEKSKKR